MAGFLSSFGLNKKGAIAREVINGAFRTLRAAGFDDTEIAVLFNEAASPEAVPSEDTALRRDEVPGIKIEVVSAFSTDDNARYEFEQRFEKLECVQALKRLSKRHERTWIFDDQSAAMVAFEGIKQALPLGAEAQTWLFSNAPAAGFTIGGFRDEWVKKATDSELDTEESFIFFDDWRFKTQFPWELIEALARYHAGRGELTILHKLKELIDTSGFSLSDRIGDQVSLAIKATEKFGFYRTHVLSLAGSGEFLRSDVQGDFSKSTGFDDTGILDNWLNQIASVNPSVKLYKRSNRWRVEVS